MNLDRFLSVADFEALARRRLPRAIYGFVCGGTEDGQTLQANRAAFDKLMFRPRGLTGVARRTQEVELWGHRYASPLGIAPMGVTAICRHECDLDLARAAANRRIPFILSGLSTVPLERVQAEAPGIWYQGYIPGDFDRIGTLMDRLKAAKVEVLIVTIDTPVGANRENNQRAGFTIPFKLSPRLVLDGFLHPRWSLSVFAQTLLRSGIPRFTNVLADPSGFRITEEPSGGFRQGRDLLTWDHLRWMRARWSGKLLVKGVSHPDDARLAVAHGLDGIIVSNHGGRQLDGAQASLQALPDVVGAVPPGFPVMIDGGFRRGTDVLKAIALGARLVFLGRPVLYGATVAGMQGVNRVIDILRTEIDRNLALLGCASLEDLSPTLLAPLAGVAADSPPSAAVSRGSTAVSTSL
jgi:L-lactate dehydrogenase (cytochrome)